MRVQVDLAMPGVGPLVHASCAELFAAVHCVLCRHPNITTAYHFLTWNYAHDSGNANASGSNAVCSTPDLATAASASAGAASIAAAAAAATAPYSSGSAAGPATPRMVPQTALNSADRTGSSEQRVQSALSGLLHTSGLAVIHSQRGSQSHSNSNSFGVKVSSAGGSSVPASLLHIQHLSSSAAGLTAAAPAPAPASSGDLAGIDAAQGGLSSSSNTGSGQHSNGLYSKLQLEQVPPFASWPLLHQLDSPHGPHSNATAVVPGMQLAPAAVNSGKALSGSLQSIGHSTGGANAITSDQAAVAAGMLSPRQAAVAAGPLSPHQAAVAAGLMSPRQAAVAAGALSPGTASGNGSWTPGSLMPVWGGGVSSPGHAAAGWSRSTAAAAALGISSHSVGLLPKADHTTLHDQQQQQVPGVQAGGGSSVAHQQQQEPEQQQPMEQEFVPMVPVNVAQPSSQGLAQQGHQQQRYVPLAAVQQQRGDGPASSNPSTQLSGGPLSSQVRQQQLTRTAGRFDTGSGGSSYIGRTKARSGEAQTWLILEYVSICLGVLGAGLSAGLLNLT
jgi:hypothetical protein